eukprot:TRINITY_DN5563_c0_g4_i1.p1 TRINITY_DN5563_c0_g4~~TRINITY_DN5563_c0_g4_i1.p1  ORF type:complete len:280 (-),score=36.88 TRINITY_DN5563_c0_g4_i1:180-1019(-)
MPRFSLVWSADVPESTTIACAALFSSCYGKWAEGSHNPGASVRLAPRRWKAEYLGGPSTFLVAAYTNGDTLQGFCTGKVFSIADLGRGIWVTQLVVHNEHRSCGIAAALLQLARMSTNRVICVGLVSSHPHALRALATATGGLVAVLPERARFLIDAAEVHYLKNKPFSTINANCIVTGFNVDHTDVNALIAKPEWNMGLLEDQAEFVGVWVKDTILAELDTHVHVQKLLTMWEGIPTDRRQLVAVTKAYLDASKIHFPATLFDTPLEPEQIVRFLARL